MKNNHQADYVIRNAILKLLSDDEVRRVSVAEAGPTLADGEEYVDLERLDRGVQYAHANTNHMGRLVPRRSVHTGTWNAIISHLLSSMSKNTNSSSLVIPMATAPSSPPPPPATPAKPPGGVNTPGHNPNTPNA